MRPQRPVTLVILAGELMPGSRCIASSFSDHKTVSLSFHIAPNAEPTDRSASEIRS